MTLNEKLKHYGLSEDEHKKALELLNKKELSVIEWALFSSLWSEHCSYKSSKNHLKNLYNTSDKLVSEEGENAGVVDLGEGERVAFKMESHNHPSFIEPFQGAATGVGGILRDIFTMGARPIALANYLCFGNKGADRLSDLIEGVVSGISFYGNCVGVPNITGQTEFDETYNKNNLVNAFALGYYGKEDKIVSSKIKTPGYSIVYVGAKTGKDGVHGASMASESFEKDNESKRPTVQIGDPFFEKCLIESCLEVMKKGLVEAVQDMGAAGITSSSFEMAFGGGLGLTLDLSEVPLRQQDMTPEEILLSESQERMLVCCDPENFEQIQKVFGKWGLDAKTIGQVRKEPEIQLLWKGEMICEISPEAIVGNAPRYNHSYDEKEAVKENLNQESDECSYNTEEHLNKALESSYGASREWIYSQYDQRVGAKTLLDCEDQIGAVVLPESKRSVGVALGCRSQLMKMDSYLGGQEAFLSPALQLSSKGYKPWAVTDCLNFGNPKKKEIMSQFVHSLQGMSEACEVFEAPVISGNVSLFNETEGVNIAPTPAVGVVGLNEERVNENYRSIKSHFVKPGSRVYLISSKDMVWSGHSDDRQIASDFQGALDVRKAKKLSEFLIETCKTKKPLSTRVVGKFGLGFSLLQMITEEVGVLMSESLSSQELCEEFFYGVVLELPKDVSLESSDFEIKKIGETSETPVFESGSLKFTFDEVKQKKDKAWRSHLV